MAGKVLVVLVLMAIAGTVSTIPQPMPARARMPVAVVARAAVEALVPECLAAEFHSSCAEAAASGGKDILALWKCVFEIATDLWKNGTWYGDLGGNWSTQ